VAPRVFRVAHQAAGLVAVRLALAAAGYTTSVAAGAEPRPAAAALAFGIGVTAVALISDRRWLLFRRPDVEPLPAGAAPGGLLRGIGSGLLPSTAGVAALLAIALAFEPILAAVLAGVLAGMGLVQLMSLADLLLRERGEGRRLYADAADPARRYVE
jgi:hypothetical protein